MHMKATFAVVNYTAVILASRELWMRHLCFADGNGPTPNPTFGVGVFRGRLRFPQKKSCTHPAVQFLWKTESTSENPDAKRRIWRGSVTISKT